MKKIPRNFQAILWSKSINKLDLEKDKHYIVHQILSYGNLKQMKWLFRIYPVCEIKEIFIKYPKKIYQPAVFYFIKNIILGLKKKRLKEEDYVKTLF